MDASTTRTLSAERHQLALLMEHRLLLQARRNADLAMARLVLATAQETLRESYRLLATVRALDPRPLAKKQA
jgi:hypothetical protein